MDEESKTENRRPRRFSITIPCPPIVDPDRMVVSEETVSTEPLPEGTTKNGRRVVSEKVTLIRRMTHQPLSVGNYAIGRIKFRFWNVRRQLGAKMRLSCDVLVHLAPNERVRGEHLNALVSELRGQRANEEILALMTGQQLDRYKQKVTDLPPIKDGLRFTDKVEVYRASAPHIGGYDMQKNIIREFPVYAFLRAAANNGELTHEERSSYRFQGLVQRDVATANGGTYPKSTKFLVACYPRFARDENDKVVAIERPGWVILLDNEDYNNINAIYHTSEVRVAALMGEFATVTDEDPNAEPRRHRRRNDRKNQKDTATAQNAAAAPNGNPEPPKTEMATLASETGTPAASEAVPATTETPQPTPAAQPATPPATEATA